MLLSLLKHGKVTTLTLRASRSGSSSAAGYTGFSSASTHEGDQRDRWKGIRKVVSISEKNVFEQGEQTSAWTTHRQPDETQIDHIGIVANPKSAWNPQKNVDKGKATVGNDKRGEHIVSQDSMDDILPSLHKTSKSGHVSRPLAGLRSNLPPLMEKGVISSASTTRRRTPSAFDSHGEFNQGTKANSSFLDALQEENSIKRTVPESLDKPISVSTKVSRLRNLMMADNPQALLIYMVRESEDLDFMRAIPGVTFVEVLRLLHPGDDFSPLRSEYKSYGPKHYWMLSGWRSRFYEALQERRQFYHDIAMRRVESGSELRLGEYTQLLNLARATWDGPMALDIMKEMIASNVRPNLDCYNHYFEARCWSDAYHPTEMQRLRVIPYNLEMRKSNPKRSVHNDVMVDGHRVEENGIRWEVTRMFTKMVNEGINADTRTYCNLMTAQSREGDLRAVKSVLHRVWNVDTDRLLAGEPDFDKQKLDKESPTYPTQDLLYTIAHVFGSNNDIPAAIRVVDHFSRKYNISISQLVWGELIQWTFVLSKPRMKKRRVDGAAAGQLPLESVESLWNVMRGPPYHSEPTLLMHDYLIRSCWRRQLSRIHLYLDHMRQGIKFHERASNGYDDSKAEIFFLRESKGIHPETLDSQKIKLAKAWSDRWFSFVLVTKWFKLLLSNQRWFAGVRDREVKWRRKMLPDAVKEFWRYRAHTPIVYGIATGKIELDDPVERTTWAMELEGKDRHSSRDTEQWVSRLAGRAESGDCIGSTEEEALAGDEDWEAEVRDNVDEQRREEEKEWEEDRAEEIRKELDDL